MSRLNSRAKGKRGEREVARLLEAWWRECEPDCKFVTTPSSGGWATAGVRGIFKAAGDLMTDAVHWPWTVEVKRREGWSERNFEALRPSPVWMWWAQCCRAALEEQRWPMLWFRKNDGDWLMVVGQETNDVLVGASVERLRRVDYRGDMLRLGVWVPAFVFRARDLLQLTTQRFVVAQQDQSR